MARILAATAVAGHKAREGRTEQIGCASEGAPTDGEADGVAAVSCRWRSRNDLLEAGIDQVATLRQNAHLEGAGACVTSIIYRDAGHVSATDLEEAARGWH